MNQNIFLPKNVLLVKNYQFDNTEETKDKIPLILDVNEEGIFMVQALVTSIQKVPDTKLNHGCTNSEENSLSFYYFEENRIVGKTPQQKDFCFHKDTFIYVSDNVTQIPLSKYQNYPKGDITLIGILNDDEYKRVIKCIAKSKFLKKKLKPIFEKILEKLAESD